MVALIKMKPKLVAIIVITVLTLSMVFSVAAAVNQAVTGESTTVGPSQQADQDSGDGTLVQSFKLICPFH